MGGCASLPARSDGQDRHAQSGPPSWPAPADDGGVSRKSNASEQQASAILEGTDAPASPSQQSPPESVYQKIKSVLQDLISISADTSDACEQAAKVLQTHLESVETITFSACTSRPGVSVLLAAAGAGAAELLQQVLVMDGAAWSPGLFSAAPEPPSFIFQAASSQEEAAELPKDWALLHSSSGLQTFMAVPVVSQGSMLGVLGLASSQPGALHECWWEPLLSIVCTGLVPLLRFPLTAGLCELAMTLAAAPSFGSFATGLLQGSAELLKTSTNMVFGQRLGLLSPTHQELLLLHSRSCNSSRGDRHSYDLAARSPSVSDPAAPAAPAAAAEDDLAMVLMAADNTLLIDAVRRGTTRVVRNTAAYLEAFAEPAHDIFVDEADLVASIVVVPVFVAGQPFGGLYVTHGLPISSDIRSFKGKVALSRLGQMLQRLLVAHPAGQQAGAWQEMLQIKTRRNSRLAGPQTPTASSGDNSWPDGLPRAASAGAVVGAAADFLGSSFDAQQAAAAAASALPGSADGVTSNPGSFNRPREPVSTTSMVQMLQAQVQRSKDRHRDMKYVEELQLHRLLGRGGFGMVYAGTWKGSPAAIKVMYVQQHERQLMKNAMEMAVLTTIVHPNIVRVYACLTDMVEEAVAGPLVSPDNTNMRFHPASQGTDEQCSSVCNIIVMECCDRGNLKAAMRQGLLHRRTINKGLVVDMRLLITVLLEVSRSLQHLHSLGVIHCDVKAENVLLQSSSMSPTGFVCKLGDFGLVKLLLGKYYITNRSGSGTVTHLAPELFEAGSKVTPGVDSFAFGIMMYELYSCQRPYAGMPAESIVARVFRQQGRPQFPPGTPAGYQALAEACWAQDKAQRPPFSVIVTQLQELLALAGGPFTCTDCLIRQPEQLSSSFGK